MVAILRCNPADSDALENLNFPELNSSELKQSWVMYTLIQPVYHVQPDTNQNLSGKYNHTLPLVVSSCVYTHTLPN